MSVSLLFRHRQGPPRFLVTFLLSMVLSTLGLSAFAQGHPELKEEDFTVKLFNANLNCGTPAMLRITYANRVAGFTKLTYKFVCTTTSGTEQAFNVANINVGQPLDIPLPADMTGGLKGSKIEVAADYGAATPVETILQYNGSVSTQSFEQNFLYINARAGSTCGQYDLVMDAYPMTGVKELIYTIKDSDGTVVHTGTATDPYTEHRFPVTKTGTYTYDVTIVPECTNPTKTGRNYGNGNWVGNNFVDVNWHVTASSNFNVSSNASLLLENCISKGQVELTVSGASGTSVTYEIRKSGETAIFKMATGTDSSEDFKAIVTDLPEGDYDVKALNACGEEATSSFSIARYFWISTNTSSTIENCVFKGKVELTVSGAEGASSFTYEIRKSGETAVIKTVTSTAVSESFKAVATDLPEGEYEVTGYNDCGHRMNDYSSFQIYPNWGISQNSSTVQTCVTESKVELSTYYTDGVSSMTYEIRENGGTEILQTVASTSAPDFKAVVNGLPYGYYQVTATNNCGLKTSTYFSVYNSWSLSIRAGQALGTCDTQVEVWANSAENASSVTYEFRKKGETAILKTVTSTSSASKFTTKVALPAGSYVVTGIADCGAKTTQSFTITSIQNSSISTRVSRYPIGTCETEVDLSASGVNEASSMTYEIRKQGETAVVTTTMSTEAPNFGAKVMLPAGNYTVTGLSSCGTTSTRDFTISSNTDLGRLSVDTPDRNAVVGCPTGVITAQLYNFPSTTPIVYELSLNGVILQTKNAQGSQRVRFEGITLPDDGSSYTYYTVTAKACGVTKSEQTYLYARKPSLDLEAPNYTHIGCNDGFIKARVYGLTTTEDVTYVLSHKGTILQTKKAKSTERITFDGFLVYEDATSNDAYTVEAQICAAKVSRSTRLPVSELPKIQIQSVQGPSNICVADGSVKVYLYQGYISGLQGQLEVYSNGVLLHSESIDKEWKSSTITGLSAGGVTARVSWGCGNPSEYQMKLEPRTLYMSLSARGSMDSYCADQQYRIRPEFSISKKGSEMTDAQLEQVKEELKQGTYELYQDEILIASGFSSDIPEVGLPVSNLGNYTLKMSSRCTPSIVLEGKINLKKPDLYFYSSSVTKSSACVPTGQIYVRISENTTRVLPDRYSDFVGYFSYELEKDGAPFQHDKITLSRTEYYFNNLPQGHYKLTIFITCDPDTKIVKEFDVEGATMPQITGKVLPTCGNMMGRATITLPSLADVRTWDVLLTRKSDGNVFFKGRVEYYKFQRDLPLGDYVLTCTPIGDCAYPQSTYEFSVTSPADVSEVYSIETSIRGQAETVGDFSDVWVTLKPKTGEDVINEVYRTTLIGEDGQTYTQWRGTYFSSLRPGRYIAKIEFPGRNCEVTTTFTLPPTNKVKGHTHPDLPCGSSVPGLGIVLELPQSMLGNKQLTFKVYKRAAPKSENYTLVETKTEAAGQSWTYIPNVLNDPDYSLFVATVSMDGREVYRGEVVKPTSVNLGSISAISTSTQKLNNVDQKLGTITASLAASRTYATYTQPFGTYTITLQNRNTTDVYTKTTNSPVAPVTFDNLPEGSYTITYSYVNQNCPDQSDSEYTYVSVAADDFVLLTTSVDATCEHNAKLTTQVRDALGIQLLTYKLVGDNGYNEVQNTTSPAVPMTFPNLAPGKYTLTAQAQLSSGGALLTQTREITINGTSPAMNITIDPIRTRPSFKGCSTGYFAFKFTDDTDANSYYYTPRSIDDNYKFFIIESPVGSGITVPMALDRNPSFTSRYANRANVSKRMNFPAGKYKFRIVNLCKTYEMEYTLLETDKNPFSDYYTLFQCESDGKYKINNIRSSYNESSDEAIYWNDLFRLTITPTLGTSLPPTPLDNLIGTELPFTPESYTQTLIPTCPTIPQKSRTDNFYTSYSVTTTCESTKLKGDEGTACEQRILVVENLSAPVGLQEIHRGTFYGLYVYPGSGNLRFTMLNQNNKVVWTSTTNPYPAGTLRWDYVSTQNCSSITASPYIYEGCPGTAFFKIYKGIGAAKEPLPVYESTKLEKTAHYVGPRFQDYTVEAYDANNILIGTVTGTTPGYTSIKEFDVYNACGRNDGNGYYDMSEVRFKVPPLEPGTGSYYLPPTTFTLTKGDKTYIGRLRSGYEHRTYYPGHLPPVGGWKEVEVEWRIVRYGTSTYTGYERPRYEYGETITGTYSICGGPEQPMSGVAQPSRIFQVKIKDGWKQTCDGWDLVVPNKAYYKTTNGKEQEVTVTGYDYTNPVTKVKYASSTLDGAVLKVPIGQEFNINLEGIPCGFTSKELPLIQEHTVDKSKSLSYYCTASGTGKHYIEAKDGTPPYTYTFYNGRGASATPIPSVPGAPNPQTSMTGASFSYGTEGQTYRVDIKDACGKLTIMHETTVLNMTNLAQHLKQEITTCSGETITLVGQIFPTAVYNWTLPSGSLHSLTPAERGNRILTLNNIQPSDAGTYTLDISPNDCSVNIRMTFIINVNHLASTTAPAQNLVVCKGTPTILAPGLSSGTTNGIPGIVDYQWYQSRDGVDFTKIPGEVNATYSYPAAIVGKVFFKRTDTYTDCSTETPVSSIDVKDGPIQAFTKTELTMRARRNKKFTLPAGAVLPAVGVTYLWERSNDGLSGWVPVGTARQFEETATFPDTQKQVFYRRTVTKGSCSVTSSNIQVRFPSSAAPMINPHLRLRVKK